MGGEGLGIGTCEVGDADGDGKADLAIGSWQYGKVVRGGGRVTLYSGATGEVLTTWTHLGLESVAPPPAPPRAPPQHELSWEGA